MAKLIGTNPEQVPLNQFLGSMAYQDSAAVVVTDLKATGAITAAGTIFAQSGGFKFPDSTTQTTAFNGGLPLNIVTATTQVAVAGNHYVLTNVATTSVTLPPTPSAGTVIWVTVGNKLTTNIIVRNGSNIQSLAENLTLDSPYTSVQLRYINPTIGWTFI